jgi:hypothetical protein
LDVNFAIIFRKSLFLYSLLSYYARLPSVNRIYLKHHSDQQRSRQLTSFSPSALYSLTVPLSPFSFHSPSAYSRWPSAVSRSFIALRLNLALSALPFSFELSASISPSPLAFNHSLIAFELNIPFAF